MSRDTDPVPDLACWAGRLSDPAREVHRAVLTAFTATGLPPPAAEIDRIIRAGDGDPDQVRSDLTEADLLAFTPGGEIRAAYPFSPAPTPIRVTWDGGPLVHAMCAIEALGMSAMLGRPVTITAAEPDTGRPITVTVDAGQARWTPRTAVVFAGDTGEPGCPSADRCCGKCCPRLARTGPGSSAGRRQPARGRRPRDRKTTGRQAAQREAAL